VNPRERREDRYGKDPGRRPFPAGKDRREAAPEPPGEGEKSGIEDIGGEELCFGRNVVIDLLRGSPERCLKVFVAASSHPAFRSRLFEICRAARVPVSIVTPPYLDRIAPGNHQGVAARIAPVPLLDLEGLLRLLPPEPFPALTVLTDHVQDPMNLGAIVRSAEAAGASGVLFPRRRGVLPTGTVLKASAGAAARLPLAGIGNVAGTIRRLQETGFWAVGLAMEAETPIWSCSMPERLLLVVGGEDEGLSRPVLSACDERVRIPMRGAVGSLNASVAAALGMFEWVRGRLASLGAPFREAERPDPRFFGQALTGGKDGE